MKIDRRGEVAGDGQLAHEPLAGLVPKFGRIGDGLVVDDDEQVIIRDIAIGAILDPIAARIGAEQDQLEDATRLACGGELGFHRILKFVEQDAGDALQLAALDGGQMIEIGAHGHGRLSPAPASASNARLPRRFQRASALSSSRALAARSSSAP